MVWGSLSGCRSPSPAGARPVVGSFSGKAIAERATPEPICELLRERHLRVLAGLPKAPARCNPNYLTTDSAFACAPSDDGVWALVASADQPPVGDEDEDGSGWCQGFPLLRLSLVHRTAAGQEVDGPSFNRVDDAYGGTETRLDASIDFDGDGIAEVIVFESVGGEGFTKETYWLKAVRGGAISDYGQAHGLTITGFEDFDRDGRPDLLYAAHRASTSDLGVAGTETSFEALAHSRPDGTFALSDDVTARFYASVCPARPAIVVVEKDGKRDDPATGKNIVCARAWGAAESELRTALEHSCASWSEQPPSCEPEHCPTSQPCPAWWKEWLSQARPQISLR